MQNPDHSAGIPDCLLEPHRVLLGTVGGVVRAVGIFLMAVLFVALGDGEDEKEGESRAGDKGEEVGIGEGVDVDEGERFVKAELVDEGGEKLRVASGFLSAFSAVGEKGGGELRTREG